MAQLRRAHTISPIRGTTSHDQHGPIRAEVRNNRQELRVYNFFGVIRTSRLRLFERKGTIHDRDRRHARHGLIVRHRGAIR